jgi:RHS repeat-associated protein
VSSLYDFTARRNSPSQGRWISPDPAGRFAVSLGTPQSWNRYAYVLNNPLNTVDPLGLEGCDESAGCVPFNDDGGGGGGGGPDPSPDPGTPIDPGPGDPTEPLPPSGTTFVPLQPQNVVGVDGGYGPQVGEIDVIPTDLLSLLFPNGLSNSTCANYVLAAPCGGGSGGAAANNGPNSDDPKVKLVNQTCQNPNSFNGYSGNGTLAGTWAPPGAITPAMTDTLLMGTTGYCVPWGNGQCYQQPTGNGCASVFCPGDTRSANGSYTQFLDQFPVQTVATICTKTYPVP